MAVDLLSEVEAVLAGEGAHPRGPVTERGVGLVLALDAINFGSGYHDVIDKLPGLSGARTMATRLRRWASDSDGPTTGQLLALDTAACTELFGQSDDDPDHQELMHLFASALVDLGRYVVDHHDGSFLAVVESAERSAVALAEQLLAMPFYRDRQALTDEVVHFYKRAQITAADLSRELGHQAPADFTDLDELTAFADNLVPHVLRVDGVLTYDPVVTAAIDSGRLLQAGSRAEIEIRACGVAVVEELTDRLRARLAPVRAMDVDLALWTRGGRPEYKAVPRHRTRTIYY
jgi:hypothetical protein